MPVYGQSAPEHPNPIIPSRPLALAQPLKILAKRLATDNPVKIVAIGSSSTAGRPPVVPYPYRLETFLRQQYRKNDKDRLINVLNRGLGGEEAPEERRRLERDVLSEQPSLVIWQVGTNAAWKKDDYKQADVRDALREGLKLLQEREPKMDIVLMDPQYVPALVAPDDFRRRTEAMEALIGDEAAAAGVSVFRRFRLMRQWHDDEQVSFDALVDPEDRDRLHQSEWSTLRVASELKDCIVEAVDRATKSAGT
jgi:lysophospholipase L1-like esterase